MSWFFYVLILVFFQNHVRSRNKGNDKPLRCSLVIRSPFTMIDTLTEVRSLFLLLLLSGAESWSTLPGSTPHAAERPISMAMAAERLPSDAYAKRTFISTSVLRDNMTLLNYPPSKQCIFTQIENVN